MVVSRRVSPAGFAFIPEIAPEIVKDLKVFQIENSLPATARPGENNH